MSQINDALKHIQKTSSVEISDSLPPLEPVANTAPSVAAGLIPALVIVLVVVAVFFIGWAMVHQPVRTLAAAPVAKPEPVAATPPVVAVTAPAVAPAAIPPPSPIIPILPKLQGIFYSATTPSAIVDGKTVRPGDLFKQYRVKKITKLEVTLMDTEGKTTTLVMGN